MDLKNVNTVLKMNMADTCVEDIESVSDSSSFDNNDFSDDPEDNHYRVANVFLHANSSRFQYIFKYI